jgi:hypothetical protein
MVQYALIGSRRSPFAGGSHSLFNLVKHTGTPSPTVNSEQQRAHAPSIDLAGTIVSRHSLYKPTPPSRLRTLLQTRVRQPKRLSRFPQAFARDYCAHTPPLLLFPVGRRAPLALPHTRAPTTYNLHLRHLRHTTPPFHNPNPSTQINHTTSRWSSTIFSGTSFYWQPPHQSLRPSTSI